MKRSLVWIFVALAITSVTLLADGTNARMAARVNDSMIVSTDWLAKHLKDDSLVLLQGWRSGGIHCRTS